LKKTESLANEKIKQGGLVGIEFLTPEEATALEDAPNYERLPDLPEIRTVTIEGCQPIPCGGTHVPNLHEIGKVLVVKAEQLPNESFRLHFSVNGAVSSS
jgi:Ser-tRNA(Ala) deacylase AlaX